MHLLILAICVLSTHNHGLVKHLSSC
uniref:Uncharacterized protein n=1 Tax=Arundo donax TaxID=35708 RepID=A0A0A9CIR0_ARUDO